MSFALQSFLHRLQTGAGARVFQALFVLIVIGAAGAVYDLAGFRNFSNREAMDMAQLGRNLAEGQGYSTLQVRPLSVYLLQNHRPDKSPMLAGAHPDLANPPVYPVLLAGLFKLLPAGAFAVSEQKFSVHLPELAVALLNQGLIVVAALLVFLLAGRLFDRPVAWVAAIVFVGSEALWRFSVSGLNTVLLIVITLGLAWCLVALEEAVRLGRPGWRALLLALLAGALVGLGGLTRYAFAWLVVPVVLYLAIFVAPRRASLCLAVLAAFLVVMAPWITRNVLACGLPFGTATFAAAESSVTFPEDRLQRSLTPNLRAVSVADFKAKLLVNSRQVVDTDLPKLGGSWVSAFFLVGLLVPFRSVALSRLRWFLLLSLGVFALVQALGRTALSAESPEINSENMLVLLAPLVCLFGAGLLFQLVENLAPPFSPARRAILSLFCLAACLPLLQRLLPPHVSPVAYPPYYPPLIQRVSAWFKPDELIMSDMPWAVAWYGRRCSMLLTLDWEKDLVDFSNRHKPIKGLYLTPLTTDTPFLSKWLQGENRSLMGIFVRREVPTGFPLRHAPNDLFPDQLLLTDYERWAVKAE